MMFGKSSAGNKNRPGHIKMREVSMGHIPGQLPRYRQLHFPDHRDLPDKSREGVSL